MSNNRHADSSQPSVVKRGGADLDLAAVRAFVTVAEDRYFSEAAARLGISQQAISKRVAKLESDLGVRLFARSRTGAQLTETGTAFLPHARSLVNIADQALEMLHGRRRRALRVDVLDTRLASIDLIQAFHETVEDVDIEIVTSNGLRSARSALIRGSVDAAFCRATEVPEEIVRVPAYLEPLHLLVGRDHPLAGLTRVEMARLSGSTVWMPGNVAGSEWAEYYDLLGAEFGIRIDTSGPDFGWEHFVAEVASGRGASFIGEGTRVPWHPDAVRVPVVDPVPVYPFLLLHHRHGQHPALGLLARHVAAEYRPLDLRRQWLPAPDRAAFESRTPG
ncbi:LysR family transcriptional regulator [Actinoallomurus oryzae]|uniref:LysR family transcriptional regulator n=1 Tax=Actinoallomurus oryzae TaxID=502180 RepID=A0ABP8QWV1_9ACTN